MWFFRAVQLPSGLWACRRGVHEFDLHELLDEAVEHLRGLASGLTEASLFVHHLDGAIEHRPLT